jgi:hypothetical protein
MEIILSRKGFDQANGGIPSPIMPDGRMVSFPIPGGGCTMNKLKFGSLNLGYLLRDLSGRSKPVDIPVHRDPDLIRELIARPRGWRPAFGQVNGALTHLDAARVGIGDLFLFFGWFRKVEEIDGWWRYIRGAPNLHVIFGWLQVGDTVEIPDRNALELVRKKYPWLAQHDHFASLDESVWSKNKIYVASRHFQLNGSKRRLPGAGAFNRFSGDLQLTTPDSPKRSRWTLPLFFMPKDKCEPLSYHSDLKRWTRNGSSVLLDSVGRGQEFVIRCDQYPGVGEWAENLIRRNVGSLT